MLRLSTQLLEKVYLITICKIPLSNEAKLTGLYNGNPCNTFQRYILSVIIAKKMIPHNYVFQNILSKTNLKCLDIRI